ncbi:MAG: DEAD/DEAH box helicase [Candidatus Hodarchaeales archaeon]
MRDGYFQRTHNFSLMGEPGFRACQLGAIWAIKSHFTVWPDIPALVSMPTGSGKTGVMIALAFELQAAKILIFTPSIVIREQIFNQFSTLELLEDIGILKDVKELPSVYNVTSPITSKKQWREITKHIDVVVSTPYSASPGRKEVAKAPDDIFDLIILDEAHHEPASTWRAIAKHFKGAKKVFLTATPFRRDRRRIKAKLVYHYPIKKAIEENIYRVVNYFPVDIGADNGPDKLASEGVRILLEERQIDPFAQILIKTDRIDKTKALVDTYKALGIKVEAIHSKKSLSYLRNIINELKQGQLDGVVAVGMLGEGLDVPNLKIAVLHERPKSLPCTIQFIGRLSRTSNKKGNAYLLAQPRMINKAVRTLYEYGSNWEMLIPKLVERSIRRSPLAESVKVYTIGSSLDLSIEDIYPFFSVKVYSTSPSFHYHFDFDKLPTDISVEYFEQETVYSPLVIVTSTDMRLPWAPEIHPVDNTYEMHIYYWSRSTQLLFEYTSSPNSARRIRKILFSETPESLDPLEIIKVLSSNESSLSEYYIVGLKNAIGRGTSNPSYKTHMGRYSEASIRIADGRIFAAGHALANIGTFAQGIALQNSRIWSTQRKSLEEFQTWCDQLAASIRESRDGLSLPRLSYLASTKRVNQLPEKPISVEFNEMFVNSILEVFIKDDKLENILLPEFKIISFSKTSGNLNCSLKFSSEAPEIKLNFSFKQTPYWKVISDFPVYIQAESNEKPKLEGKLEDFLQEYPPTFVMPDASVIIGSQLLKPMSQSELLPQDTLKPLDWSGCDITKETDPGRNNLLNVQQKTEQHIKKILLRPDDILINDDRAREVADFVLIQGNPPNGSISFFHCKSSSKPFPGARVKDADEVIGQASRCAQWIFSPKLLERLKSRLHTGKVASKIVAGDRKYFLILAKSYSCNEWTYKVYIVQPGIKIDKIKRSGFKNVHRHLVGIYDRIRYSCHADLEVWGS